MPRRRKSVEFNFTGLSDFKTPLSLRTRLSHRFPHKAIKAVTNRKGVNACGNHAFARGPFTERLKKAGSNQASIAFPTGLRVVGFGKRRNLRLPVRLHPSANSPKDMGMETKVRNEGRIPRIATASFTAAFAYTPQR